MTVVLILAGLAAVGLVVAVAVVFAAVVATAWLVGLVVGVFRSDSVACAKRYAATVMSLVREVH